MYSRLPYEKMTASLSHKQFYNITVLREIPNIEVSPQSGRNRSYQITNLSVKVGELSGSDHRNVTYKTTKILQNANGGI